MVQDKCIFGGTMASGQFGCEMARSVVRRGGVEFDCAAPAAHVHCAALFERLKTVALPAFGVEDDLLSMPHSVQIKIQLGGLLGLKRLLQEETPDQQLPDIYGFVGRVLRKYGGPDDVPCGDVAQDMINCKLKRRGAR